MTARDNKHNERLAIHEAAHSLVANRLGYEVISVTIERNKQTGAEGETIVIHPKANIITSLLRRFGLPNEIDDEDHIAYCLAGIEAVRISGCEKTISIEGSPLSDDIIEARSDIIEAKRIAKCMGGGGQTFGEDFAYVSGKSKAAVILERNAAALNAIARALIESKTLSGIEIAKIIETHTHPKRKDRIPVNAICTAGPCTLFDTNDDVVQYEMAIIRGEWYVANSQSRFWLRETVSVKALYHGPYQGYVAPDAPQSTRDALAQFEISQIQILEGEHNARVAWVLDTNLRCSPQIPK